ncbi:hypothetical protein IJX73_01480 [bacterium]|nr:hypothetical protein [bacterium]
MTSEIGFNSSQFLQLDSDIRISATSAFNAQEAYENTFEDVLLEEVSKAQEQKPKENKVNFYNLGAPAGFFLDNSLLEEMEANGGDLQNQNSKSFNPYLMIEG